MSIDLSKLCADFLRQNQTYKSSEKFKASHSRELVAAFFGYKSHAALMSEKTYPLEKLVEANIFVPDILLIKNRMAKLSGLPSGITPPMDIAKLLSDFLINEGLCAENVWLYDTLESYITEVLLINSDSYIMDELSGVMAETNTSFAEDYPYYSDVQVEDVGEALIVTASGKYQGEPLDDKPFSGDTIDLRVQITLPRIAGKRGFYDFELEVGGSLNDDWVDPELKYGVPNVRPKEQWLEMTGGFRFGESPEQFQNRQVEIHSLRNRLAEGKHTVRDIDRLSNLLGTDEDDEFGGMY